MSQVHGSFAGEVQINITQNLNSDEAIKSTVTNEPNPRSGPQIVLQSTNTLDQSNIPALKMKKEDSAHLVPNDIPKINRQQDLHKMQTAAGSKGTDLIPKEGEISERTLQSQQIKTQKEKDIEKNVFINNEPEGMDKIELQTD